MTHNKNLSAARSTSPRISSCAARSPSRWWPPPPASAASTSCGCADFDRATQLATRADELAQASRGCVDGPYSYERGAAAYRLAHIHTKRDQPAAEIDGEDPLLEAEARVDIATMAQLSGDTLAAATFYESARDHLEAALGPAYAAEKSALISLNLGLTMLASGERGEAERQLEAARGARAHKVAIRAHAGLVQLSLLGAAQDPRERQRAAERAEQLLARLGEANDVPDLDRGYALFYAGQALAQIDRCEGLDALERALEVWRSGRGVSSRPIPAGASIDARRPSPGPIFAPAWAHRRSRDIKAPCRRPKSSVTRSSARSSSPRSSPARSPTRSSAR